MPNPSVPAGARGAAAAARACSCRTRSNITKRTVCGDCWPRRHELEEDAWEGLNEPEERLVAHLEAEVEERPAGAWLVRAAAPVVPARPGATVPAGLEGHACEAFTKLAALRRLRPRPLRARVAATCRRVPCDGLRSDGEGLDKCIGQ